MTVQARAKERSRKWLKRGALLAALLMAAASLNVVVAWACVLWTPPEPVYSDLYRVDLPRAFQEADWHEWVCDTAVLGAGYEETGVTWVRSIPEFEMAGETRFLAGFPCTALWAVKYHGVKPPDLPRPAPFQGPLIAESGIAVPAPFQGAARASRLPCQPAWPGFAINTGLYTGLIAALAIGPQVLRRRLRMRHGQCVSCGYEIKDLAVGSPCPECGHTQDRCP